MAGFQIDMSPLNRSSRNIGQSLVNIGQTVGTAIGQSRQRDIQQQEQGDIEAFMQQAMSGDPSALKELMVKSPQAYQQVTQYLQQQQATIQAGDELQAGERLKANQETIKKLYRVQSLEGEAKVTAIQEILDNPFDDFDDSDLQFMSDPKYLNASAVELFGADDAKAMFGGASKLEQAKGKGMEGYAFNTETGAYSINDNLKAKLNEIKANPVLDIKDRIAINKDFTQLTKDTKLIRNTAADLDKLSKIKSGPASIAMIFKFMKALDPTSVVREGEFATAENSAGIPAALRNTYNKLMEGGRLGPVQVEQFVRTAKELANSAIDSSDTEITSFINTFEDTLPSKFKVALMNRIPKRFEFKAATEKPVVDPVETDPVPAANVSQNDQALLFIQENPNDPRIPAIKQKLGIK